MTSILTLRWLRRVFLALSSLFVLAACSDEDGAATNNAKNSCVRFFCILGNGKIATGSGFLINDRGDVVTNNHVIAGATKIFVLNKNNGQIRLFLGETLHKDPEADLAVVKTGIKAGPRPLTVNLAVPKEDITGKTILSSLGFPGIADTYSGDDLAKVLVNKIGREELKTTGVDITRDMQENLALAQFIEPSLSGCSVRRLVGRPLLQVDNEGERSKLVGRNVDIIEFNGQIAPGHSGGPLLDQQGNVVGVVGQNISAIEQPINQVQFAITSKELGDFLQDHSVPFKKVFLSSFGWTTMQKSLIALAAAALIVGVVLVIYLTRAKTAPGSIPTTLIRQRIDQFMNGGRPPAGHPDAGPAPQPHPQPQASGVAWELDVSGKDGHRQQINLTEADFTKGRGRVIVGRSVDFCGVTIRHDSVSRQQFHFALKNGSLYVADRNSSNGTKVSGGRLEAPFREHLLKEGDHVEFGSLVATVHRRF